MKKFRYFCAYVLFLLMVNFFALTINVEDYFKTSYVVNVSINDFNVSDNFIDQVSILSFASDDYTSEFIAPQHQWIYKNDIIRRKFGHILVHHDNITLFEDLILKSKLPFRIVLDKDNIKVVSPIIPNESSIRKYIDFTVGILESEMCGELDKIVNYKGINHENFEITLGNCVSNDISNYSGTINLLKRVNSDEDRFLSGYVINKAISFQTNRNFWLSAIITYVASFVFIVLMYLIRKR